MSPLLIILVMEETTRECRVGGLWELLYADDLALTAETLGKLELMFEEWRQAMERRGAQRAEGKLGKDKDDGGWRRGIRVECAVMVLELTLFYVECVGSGVIGGVWG